MATKNYGIVGVGSDVQFGKGGARLVSNGSALAAVLSNSTANAVAYAPLLIGTPTSNNHAANKDYVDGVFQGLGNLFDYTGVVSGSADRDAPFNLGGLSKTSAGSFYKIAETGWFSLNGTELFGEAGDGWIFTDSGEVSLVPQDDNSIVGTANFVTVVGSLITGYTIDLDEAFKARLANAETDIDALALTVGNVQTEIDTIEESIALLANGAYSANTNTNYIGNVSTVQGALEALDRSIAEVAARPVDLLVSSDETVSVHAVGNSIVTMGSTDAGLELTFANGITLEATGTAVNADITLVPMGNGVVSTNNARLANLAAPTEGTDAVNLNTLDAYPMMRMAGRAIAGAGGTIAVSGKVMKVRVEITQPYPETASIEITRGATIFADSTAEIDATTVGTYMVDVMNDAGGTADVAVTVRLGGQPYTTGQGSVWVEWSTTYTI